MRKALFTLVILALLAAACGGSGASQPAGSGKAAGDANAGKELFARPVLGTSPGCITCHSLEPGKTLVGPSLAGIAGQAGNTVAGQSAEQYLRQSITEPDAHVAKGFQKGLMLKVQLTDAQVSDLTAYLLTLK